MEDKKNEVLAKEEISDWFMSLPDNVKSVFLMHLSFTVTRKVIDILLGRDGNCKEGKKDNEKES